MMKISNVCQNHTYLYCDTACFDLWAELFTQPTCTGFVFWRFVIGSWFCTLHFEMCIGVMGWCGCMGCVCSWCVSCCFHTTHNQTHKTNTQTNDITANNNYHRYTFQSTSYKTNVQLQTPNIKTNARGLREELCPEMDTHELFA